MRNLTDRLFDFQEKFIYDSRFEIEDTGSSFKVYDRGFAIGSHTSERMACEQVAQLLGLEMELQGYIDGNKCRDCEQYVADCQVAYTDHDNEVVCQDCDYFADRARTDAYFYARR